MSKFAEKHARNLVVMLTAGGSIDDILEMAKAFNIRPVHLDQLAVPPEEESARKNIITALRSRDGIH